MADHEDPTPALSGVPDAGSGSRIVVYFGGPKSTDMVVRYEGIDVYQLAAAAWELERLSHDHRIAAKLREAQQQQARGLTVQFPDLRNGSRHG